MDRTIVYYNGGCPVCSAEISHYRRLAWKSDAPLDWVNIKEHPDALAEHGLGPDDLMRRLHVKRPDGSLLTGVDAFTAVWRHLKGYRHLAKAAEHRRVRPGVEWLYENAAAPALFYWNKHRDRRQLRKARGAAGA